MSQLENYISQWGNPFNIENEGTQNLAAGASQFLLNVMPSGESAYVKFQKGRIKEKSVQLFDIIPKTRIPSKLSTKKKTTTY